MAGAYTHEVYLTLVWKLCTRYWRYFLSDILKKDISGRQIFGILFPERCELRKDINWLTEWACIDVPKSQIQSRVIHYQSWYRHLFPRRMENLAKTAFCMYGFTVSYRDQYKNYFMVFWMHLRMFTPKLKIFYFALKHWTFLRWGFPSFS